MLKKALFLFIFVTSFTLSGFAQPASAVCTDQIGTSLGSEAVGINGGFISPYVWNNTSWTATSNVSWITVNYVGINLFNATYTTNTGSGERIGTITLSTSCASATYTVAQMGTDDFLHVDAINANQTFTYFGTIFVSSNTTWEANIPSNAHWISFGGSSWTRTGPAITNPMTITLNKFIPLYYDVNTGSPRSTTITITTTGSGTTQTKYIPITQGTNSACNETISVSPDSHTYDSQEHIYGYNNEWFTPTITSSTWWNAEGDYDWLSGYYFGNGITGVLAYNILENTSTSSRTGTITVAASYTGCARATFTVTQLGAQCTEYINVSPATESVGSTDGSVTPVVTSNTSWSAVSSTAGTTDDWLTVTTGVNSFTADYAKNNDPYSRTATVTLSDGGCATTVYTITQAGDSLADFINVNKTTLTIPSPSGNDSSIEVSSNTTWTADIATNSWLSFDSGGTQFSIAGNAGPSQPIQIYYSTNTSSSDRGPVRITFTTTGHGTPQVAYVDVTQLKLDSLTVNKLTLNINSPAGSDSSIVVTSNVTWKADIPTNSTWIRFNNGHTPFQISGNPGTIPITIYFDANTSAYDRGPVRITFTSTGTGTPIVRYVDVTQFKADLLTVNKNSMTVPTSPMGSDNTIAVTSNVSWKGEIPSGTTWLKFSNNKLTMTGSSGVIPITINYLDNTSASSRTPVIITFTTTGNGNPSSAQIIINQMGTGDSLIVNPTAVIVPSLFGTNNDLRVSANVNWTADIAPNPWLTFNAGPTPLHMNGSPVFDFPVTLYFDTNTASTARGPVQITFTSNGGGTPVVKFVDVTQSGVIVPFDTLTVNRTDLTVGSSSGSDNTTTVTSNVSWMADMASNSWLSFSNGSTNLHITGGVGTNPVTLYYLSNNSIFNRGPVRITFTSTGTGTPVVKYLDVTQSGFSIFPDTLTLNKSTLIVPTAPLGSDSTVSVTSNTTWVADIPNNTTWFAFDSALSLFHITGSGSTPVTIYYDANTSTADRVPVTVTFTSTGNGTPVVRNLEVKQCGTGGCAGGLRPKYSPF